MAFPILTITDAAADRVRDLIARRDGAVAGMRLSVGTRGCSGLSYEIDYAGEARPGDEVIEDKGITLFVDPAATMYLLGSEMDYVESQFETGFVFTNPNEKGRCGCGESFHV